MDSALQASSGPSSPSPQALAEQSVSTSGLRDSSVNRIVGMRRQRRRNLFTQVEASKVLGGGVAVEDGLGRKPTTFEQVLLFPELCP